MQQEGSNMIKWRSVRIPNKLYEEVNQRKEDLNCTSVSEVARKALEEFLTSHKEKGGN
jgi:metal-responsive CopG/Arc/MetJ family transcriptional regulator